MKKDNLIRMAREAGFHQWYTMPEEHPYHVDIIERFAALVRADEREACAKVCEIGQHSEYDGHAECAAAIRAQNIT